jgi:short subunit dehydrogenase-like uncharacterized protein
MSRRERPFDVVLFGATGFTGRLVAEYLLLRLDKTGLRLALAGRNRDKLERIRSELASSSGAAASLPLLVADSHDRGALDAVARDAAVVCSTVGPYAKHGEELVAACVAHGTDYCDLTGEPQFIRRMIDRHHDEAGRSGARIVHCCGFDSVPSDLGTLMLVTAAEERGGRLREVKLFAGESRGGFSGGTVASMMNVMDEAKDPAVRRILGDPYALYPTDAPRGEDGPDQRGVRFDPDLGMWTGPFIMASVNTRVVRRSNALLGFRYGRDFHYSEATSTGRGPAGLARAAALAGGLGAFAGAMALGPTRKLIGKKLPVPGEGPSQETRERGYFVIRLVGKGEADGHPLELRGRVEGTQDPGYGETAKMLGEAALCLAVDGPELGAPGGVRTPASTMGMRLVERLRNAGMVFDVG